MTLSKKILLSSFAAAMTFSGASFAVTPGFYVQGALGQSNTNPNASADWGNVSSGSSKGTGFAGRLAAGYQFDQFWGAELGWTAFAKTEYSNLNKIAGNNASYTQNVFDVLGKASYSFDNGFGVFAKAGVGFVRQSNSAVAGIVGGISKINATRPTAALGVRYDFNQNVGVDLSWQRYFKGGNLTQNSDFYGVGLIYSFG
jgi:hypothetical protein